ncbi:uncharacterized protein MEPE_03197 [Melanopsichium pennsylvanicum]|uniref:Phosphoglycerate mutase n=2 Tax=Melanopsichium pennsylvanicum TaxID=63383 RepID=A0AAJ4XNX1_9BASI|nr:phosphoglycerate mutase [Melanopsichium pennsylvanicum 4]SNX84488.1 uncharacterized protein MEPE_03197 [Melanopsichium pennsylvanicum]
MALNRLLVTLVRHGESQDNQHGIWAGFRDTPLTSNGIGQARALGQSFANVPLTAIYCSDLKRAAMTADEVLKSNRSIPPPPLVQSKSLREINFGQAEGQEYAMAQWMSGSTGQDARNFRFPEGESLEEVNARTAKAVRQFILPRIEALRKKPPADGNVGHICIVAHGIAIAELLRVFMALHGDPPSCPWPDPKKTYQRVRLENTGWSRLEVAVPFQGDDGASSSTSTGGNGSSTTTATSSARSGTQSEYTDFGEVQTDLVEGPSDASRKQSTSRAADHGARPIYVRILCQNQIDHLRGFSSQQSSANTAAKTVAHLAGGGSSKSSGGNSPAPGTASTTPATVGLPPSATLASIASNATSSNSHTNRSMTPSTPAIGAFLSGNGASKSSTTTPASARSLVAYDARMMARELERAGAAPMLAGSEAASSSGAGASCYLASSSASTLSGDRQGSVAGSSTPSGGVTNAGGGLDGSFVASPVVGNTANSAHPMGTQSASSTIPASTLFSTYPQATPGSMTSATSPNPAGLSFPVGPGASSDTWQMICIRVLPLFNGEALRTSIEELNEMVSLHVRKRLERSQAHTLDSLTFDLVSLASTGTLTLNSKLQGLEDTRLLLRLVEVWTFFLGQVLPYCEGCFLPFQTDPTLRSLIASSASYGVGSSATGAAGVYSNVGPFSSSANLTHSGGALIFFGSANADFQRIDVRKILLVVFRDQVLLPIYERLSYLFSHLSELDPAFSAVQDTTSEGGGDDGIKQVSLRLLQMISVLASILSDDEAQDAMDNLLRALRLGTKSTSAGRHRGNCEGLGARSTSPTHKNNRRGWMAQKARKHGAAPVSDAFSGKATIPFGSGSTFGGAGGMFHTTQATSEGVDHVLQRAFLGRPNHLASFRDPIGPNFGADMTEDEYLTSLRSPAGSPAISTPGYAEASDAQALDRTGSSLATDTTNSTQFRSDGDQTSMDQIAGQRTSLAISPTLRETEQAATTAALTA